MGAQQSVVCKESPTLKQMCDPEFLSQFDGTSQKWTSDINAVAPVRLANKGVGATPTGTVPALFKEAVKKHGSAVALRAELHEDGRPPVDGKEQGVPFKEWTWAQYYTECVIAAKAFVNFGLEHKNGVCVWGFNAPEWHMSQMAATLASGVAAGIYPTDNIEQVEHKAFDTNAVVACVQGKKQVDTLAKLCKAGKLPMLRAVVYWTPETEAIEGFTNADGVEVKVVFWKDLPMHMGTVTDRDIDDRQAQSAPGSCVGIIYTSGTTGKPKGVMVSHDNVIYETAAAMSGVLDREVMDTIRARGNKPIRSLSYLPLSHVAGMVLDIVGPVVTTATTHPWTVTFARATDLKEGTLKFRLLEVRPTVFLGVPRVWEKIQEGILAARAQNPPGCCMEGLIKGAKASGAEYANNRLMGGTGRSPACYTAPWNQAVFNKAKNALGLDQCLFAVSGAAPIQASTVDFFGALGIIINDFYGMSEGTGMVCMSHPKAHLPGSVGYAVEGTECALLKESVVDGVTTYVRVQPCPASLFDSGDAIPEEYQGEICYRGRGIMMGYLTNPAYGDDHVASLNEKNAEAIDADGWLHSGDKGTVCTRGMFKITGRYKELIIGAGGENIAPVPIEAAIKDALGGQGGVVSNVMMVGDKRKFNTCLITLTCEGANGEKPGSDVLAGGAAKVSSAKVVRDACNDKTFTDKITAAIAKVCKDGHVCPSAASRVGKFTILPNDFSVEGEEFTPTLKLKRKVVELKHHNAIEAMYAPEAEKLLYVPYKA
eukprot:TRINITY_DN6658_c0_g2_i1.p1 TRINITY_DN6658_c0_g2~~TRINITY_DN6658_c0_g2_i1.p1  ORF type:complete len:767 (+),score=285.42 TRINITY_DN6658_c0_g2_i1:78-2378(+)